MLFIKSAARQLRPGESSQDQSTYALFNRQFIAGRTTPNVPSYWLTHTSLSGFIIATHPLLPVTQQKYGNRELICLGWIIDPLNPSHNAAAVLTALLTRCTTFSAFETATSDLGGRWLVFITIDGASRLYPDATAGRTAFFKTGPANAFWIASQPQLMSKDATLTLDTELIRAFLLHSPGSSWPADTTPYHGLRQLLANHFLDLHTGRCHRFWPVLPLPMLHPKHAIERVVELVCGFLASLSAQRSVALPLTAGYDSRVLFACSLRLRTPPVFFTITDPAAPSHDVDIPRALAKMYQVPYRVIHSIPCSQTAITIQKLNVANMWWDPERYKLPTFNLFHDHIVLTGALGELFRSFYYNTGPIREPIAPTTLARASGYTSNPIATSAFAAWLAHLPACDPMTLLDLFYWEQRAAGWLALGNTALDTYTDVVPPFNCRSLLEIGLSTDYRHKIRPHTLFRNICELLAPKARYLPFNDSAHSRLVRACASILPWRVRHRLTMARMRAKGHDWFPAPSTPQFPWPDDQASDLLARFYAQS